MANITTTGTHWNDYTGSASILATPGAGAAVWNQATDNVKVAVKMETSFMVTPYVHRACGCIAFFKIGEPWKEGELVMAKDVIWANGDHPLHLDIIKCGGCGGVAQNLMTDLVATKQFPKPDWSNNG